jgi:RNA polymerase sigma-70 factor (ECF subfamily)
MVRLSLRRPAITAADAMRAGNRSPLRGLVILATANVLAGPSIGRSARVLSDCGALAGAVTPTIAMSELDSTDVVSDPEITLPANHQNNQELDRFFASHEENAYYVAYAALWHHETALDVVQDSMLKLVEYYRNKPPAEWPALFRTILNSRINDVRRRRLIEQGKHKLVSFTGLFRKDPDNGNAMQEPDVPAEEERDDHITAPEAGLVAEQLRRKVTEALHSLSERQRQVFVLREWRGMTTLETARTLGCSENSVKQHHFRALRELRKLLAEVWDYA